MPLLLDTHVLVWLAEDAPELRPEILSVIDEAGLENDVLISIFSFWEVSLLISGNRLTLRMPIDDWTEAVVSEPGLTVAPLTPRIATACHRLPGRFHRDPADRILVATAREMSAILVTRDARILRYAEQGHVQAMAA